jgi:TonB family protein
MWCHAQPPTPAAMPSDAKELMRLAAGTNGLSVPDLQPWHFKASYQIFDAQGNAKGHGTYEEFWVNQTKFKQIITSDTLTQTKFGTDHGMMGVGDQVQPALPWQLNALRRDLTNPLPSESSLDTEDFADQPDDGGNGHTRCISVSGPARFTRKADGATTYSEEKRVLGVFCFNREKPILETRTEGATKTTFSNPVTLQGHYLPRNIELTINGQVVLSANLDVIENIKTVNDADFTPPADAIPVRDIKLVSIKRTEPGTDAGMPTNQGQVNISGGVAYGLLLSKVDPIYPAAAKAGRVQGTVVLQAKIGKDGHVSDLHVVSGPALLQEAAVDAVNQWTYRPYLLNGNPVEVMTTVNVVFMLGEAPTNP